MSPDFEKSLLSGLLRGVIRGVIVIASSLIFLFLFKTSAWVWPDAIYTMPNWLAGPLLLMGFASVMLLPTGALYSFVCLVGVVWLDHREVKRGRERDARMDKTLGV